jgi:hypothetical protein
MREHAADLRFCQTRLTEVQKEKAGWETILPIFFYNDTLFPFSPLALYLFEPRYKVRSAAPFAVKDTRNHFWTAT